MKVCGTTRDGCLWPRENSEEESENSKYNLCCHTLWCRIWWTGCLPDACLENCLLRLPMHLVGQERNTESMSGRPSPREQATAHATRNKLASLYVRGRGHACLAHNPLVPRNFNVKKWVAFIFPARRILTFYYYLLLARIIYTCSLMNLGRLKWVIMELVPNPRFIRFPFLRTGRSLECRPGVSDGHESLSEKTLRKFSWAGEAGFQ